MVYAICQIERMWNGPSIVPTAIRSKLNKESCMHSKETYFLVRIGYLTNRHQMS